MNKVVYVHGCYNFSIFSLSGNSYAERVTLNIGGCARRSDQEHNSKVLEVSGTRVHTITEADVVAAEHMVDGLLLHLAEVIDELSNLRHHLNVQNGGFEEGTKRKAVQLFLTYRH